MFDLEFHKKVNYWLKHFTVLKPVKHTTTTNEYKNLKYDELVKLDYYSDPEFLLVSYVVDKVIPALGLTAKEYKQRRGRMKKAGFHVL